MKKIYITFLALSLILSANAQITQSNHAPVAGDAYTTYQCDSTGVTPGASGANATWNFAMATRTAIALNYLTSAASNPEFPSATVGVATSSSNTSYYNASSTGLAYYGGNLKVGMVVLKLKYSSPAVVMAYPMTLNTSSTAPISGSVDVAQPPTSGTFSGSSIATADATGTLTVAGQTFSNVIRVVTSQTLNTSIIGASINQTVYDYYDINVKKAPIFTIATATANLGMFGTTTQTLVTRLFIDPNSTTGLSQNNPDVSQVLVFPNPSSGEMSFHASAQANFLNIYDLTGKLIETSSFENGQLKLNVAPYNKGLYIYRITDNSKKVISTGKITVID